MTNGSAIDKVMAGIAKEAEAAFLAHYGRKGMKWGRHIFTKRGGDGKSEGGSETKSESSSAGSSSKPDEVTHVSADAERFIRTHQKQGVEMSDREIREAINRANMVKQYDEIFNPGPNSELKAKVEQLQLQRDYKQLQAQMKPPSTVQRLIKGADTSFTAYQKLNEATGGEMNKALEQALGLKSSGGKHKSKESAFSGKREK